MVGVTMEVTTIDIIASAFFAIALLHTFSATYFKELGNRSRKHAGLFHLLGEVEVVFGFWAMVFILAMMFLSGFSKVYAFTDEIEYSEPIFVFGIMVVAASKPILTLSQHMVNKLAAVIMRMFLCHFETAAIFVVLCFIPLFSSLITEPAAMTIAALTLRDKFFAKPMKEKIKYMILGVLFLNISVGGTLTHYAAPPVLMVASTWNWDTATVFNLIGNKSLLIVFLNALWATLLARREIAKGAKINFKVRTKMPISVYAIHLSFMVALVYFLHHSVLVIGLVLLFLGYCQAYTRWQRKLILREALLVAFFLAGLKTLGDFQAWWINPAMTGIAQQYLYYLSMTLTAFIDNAAITYLGALVENPSEFYKVALVSGAVTGGGLTIIANAPNPAGVSLLQGKFENKTISALNLLFGALPPTILAVLVFQLW